MEQWNQIFAAVILPLPTYYPTTVIEAVNATPADMDVSATVKVEDEE